MVDPEISKSTDFLMQIGAVVGTAIAAGLAFMRGGKAKQEPPLSTRVTDEIEKLRRERAEELAEQLEQMVRDLALEFKAVRADFELILKAHRESTESKFHDLDQRSRALETLIAVLNDRDEREREARK